MVTEGRATFVWSEKKVTTTAAAMVRAPLVIGLSDRPEPAISSSSRGGSRNHGHHVIVRSDTRLPWVQGSSW
ncbi:Protein kinase domain-containing protein [Psidium guajava]|nr:Protein kinase domain-containing protein [Psidium guajava]